MPGKVSAQAPASSTARRAKGYEASTKGRSEEPKTRSKVAGPPGTAAAKRSTVVSTSAEDIVGAVKVPEKCVAATCSALARLLGTSEGGPGHAAVQHESTVVRAPTDTLGSEAKRVRLAKLVVNGVLTSLNELIKSDWQAKSTAGKSLSLLGSTSSSKASSTSGSSRSSPAPSQRSQAASSSATPKVARTVLKSSASKDVSLNKDVSQANVRALVDCYRAATRFLLQVKASSSEPEAKEIKNIEIESVMVSIVSKLIGLGLLASADAELRFLHKAVSGLYHDDDEEPMELYLFAIPRPETPVSTKLENLVLDLQSLSLTCILSSASLADLVRHARLVHDHASGPLSWQRYVRRADNPSAAFSADQASYHVERSIGRCLARLNDDAASSSHASSLLEATLEVRKVSLDFLMLVSDLDVDAFWDRCGRVGVSYFRGRMTAEGSDASQRAQTFAAVDDVFRDLVQLSNQVRSDVRMKSVTGFDKFCETWMDLAKRAGMSSAIDRIASLAASVGPGSGEVEPMASSSALKTTAQENVCMSHSEASAALAKGVIALEQVTYSEASLSNVEGILATTVVAIDATSREQKSLMDWETLRSVDQLRRRALKLLDAETNKSQEAGGSQATLASVVDALRPVVLAIVSRLEACLREVPRNEWEGKDESEQPAAMLAGVVQAMRILSHSTFSPGDKAAVDACEQHMARCRQLIEGNAGKLECSLIDDEARSENLYFVSSSMWHFGGRLYNDAKYQDALRFLRPSCEMADIAVSLARGEEGQRTKWSPEKAREGLPKRWSQLASSYNMTLQPQLALQAYTKALEHLSKETWPTVSAASSSTAICDIFTSDELSSTLAQMAKQTVDAFSSAETYEQEDDKLPWLIHLSQTDENAFAACLEYCLLSLDNSLHRTGAPRTAFAFISVLESVYRSEKNPLRRARVLLRRLELRILLGGPETVRESDRDTSQLVDEIRALLYDMDLQDDTGLARYRLQYQATLELLLTLCGQQARSTAAQQSVVHSAKAANTALRRISEDNVTDCGDKTIKKKTGAKNRPLKVTQAPRQAKATPHSASPTTPPSKKLINGATQVLPQSPAMIADAATYDDIERLCSLIELVYEAINAFGHTLASVELLKVLRRLNLTSRGLKGRDGYLKASADLTRQYLLLGRLSRAEAVIKRIVERDLQRKDWGISENTRARCLFAHADSLCYAGRIEESTATYDEAVEIASQIQPSATKNSVQAFVERCQGYERQALAYDICASIQYAKGDLTAAIAAAIESVRFASKTSNSLAKLTGPKEQANNGSPFADRVPSEAEGQDEASKHAQPPKLSSWSVATAHWRTIKMLLLSYLRVSRLNMYRGTARDAEAYASEAVAFGASLNIHLSVCQALIERGGVRIQMAQTETGEADLDQVMSLLEDDWIPEAVSMTCIRGDRMSRTDALPEALKFYVEGQDILGSLSTAFAELDSILPSPRQRNDGDSSRIALPGHETLLPRVKARLLRRQAWLLELMGRNTESQEFLEQAMLVETASQSASVEDALVAGRIAIRQSMQKLRADQVLGMLAESSLSLPMMSRGVKAKESSASKSGSAVKAAVNSLSSANATFTEALQGRSQRCGESTEVRDTIVHLSTSRLLHATLSRKSIGQHLATNLCDLIDAGASVTLQRELLDAIESKLRPRELEARQWFRFRGFVPSKTKAGPSSPSIKSDPTSESGEPGTRQSYWCDVARRHQQLELGQRSSVAHPQLPPTWTVVSITVSPDRDHLILSRRGGAQEPIVFSLPIDRQSRREGEEEALTVDAALEELRDIVEESNHATHAAKDLEGLDARKKWWSQRRELDARLKVLLEGIETTWLGAFKSVFLPSTGASDEELDTLRASLNAILGQSLTAASPLSGSSSKRGGAVGAAGGGSNDTNAVKLDDAVVECFARLTSSETTDEDLEDMLHFIMDAYQFNGVPVAVDEVDLDQSVVDVRSALESLRSKRSQRRQRPQMEEEEENAEHLFLILDRDTCAIPWESIPTLRSRAVSRIPSMAFLEDRLVELRGARGKTIDVEMAKKFYLINPAGDLTRTQERFEPLLAKDGKGQWTGIAGRTPLLDEYANALSSNDVVVYFGHGGAEQYIRSHKLKSLQQCAVTMLWGCSSAMLRDQGDFDRCGTAYNYVMAGCPALVGNLWDATDRELDGISESVLEKVGLTADSASGVVTKPGEKRCGKMSLTRAVAASRGVCKLPYLSGAACVVYGIPVYFS